MSSSSEDDAHEFDSWDASNDQYYRHTGRTRPDSQQNYDSYHEIPKYGSNTILHSLPAYDLWLPLFPTNIDQGKLRNLHRPKLRHYNTGPQARFKGRKLTKPAPIKNLTRTIYRFQKRLRNRVISAINRQVPPKDIIASNFIIKSAKGLSAKHGELFLFEYSEEYPPVLSQVGMASNVKTFIQPDDCQAQRTSKGSQQNSQQTSAGFMTGLTNSTFSSSPNKNKKSRDSPKFGFETIVNDNTTNKPVYYSKLDPGAQFQVIENNLYRAPIYKHQVPDCDFLVIRTRNSFYIRSVETIFTVGQTMPLVAIPTPNDSSVYRFRQDLSNVYIHRLFRSGDYDFPALRFNTLCKLFPDYHESVLKRRLRIKGAEPVRVRNELVFTPGSSGFGSLSVKELRRCFTPEQYCINMASMAAGQRLRELNYSESMIHPPPDAKVESEVLAAPWNTSRAVLGALAGRHYLDFKDHLIDPTGQSRREGFSCVAWDKSPTEQQQIKDRQTERSQPCDKRTPRPFLDKNPLAPKIKSEKLERLAIYQKEARLISQLQSKVLASNEVLSSDDGSESEEDENAMDAEFDRNLQDLGSMVVNGRTIEELNYRKEEQERRKLLADLMTNGRKESPARKHSATESDPSADLASLNNKVLIITRKFDSPEGMIERKEIVREPRIIAYYIKQKSKTSPTCNGYSNGSTNGNSNENVNQSHSQVPLTPTQNGTLNSSRLGPKELCRADGTRLIISKKVLDTRSMRHDRRSSCFDST